MKFLLSVLGSLNVFSISAGAITTPVNNNIAKISLSDQANFTNINDYLNSILLLYYYTEYHDFVEEDGYLKVCNVDSFSISDPKFLEDPIITNTPAKYSQKTLVHSENDNLKNDSDEQQTMQSASFSKTYIDSLAYSTTKTVGLELQAPIKFLNTKLNFTFSSNKTTTNTTQTKLTAPSQGIKVPAHSKMSVTYNIYEQNKIYNELISGKLDPDTMIQAKFTNDMSIWSGNYRTYSINDSIGKIMSCLYDNNLGPDDNNVIYKKGDDIYVQTNAKIQTITNELDVDIKPEN
ncbi:ETX/MTX2 family pore-forming toxin [Mesoplasma tabanidae]|uniref:Uncharacterized protein n=1 Tax=Mesoplasma tabanidae TaxID=219745 RepID=A0A2K8P5E9_9MOLU|nr:ETX/MTX2 family pore-forming toxin [Mesoplasma tabanidae]ATZ21688.1 hypothetical protein MTABA_v1c04900 [Mesoplasma tabanidae]